MENRCILKKKSLLQKSPQSYQKDYAKLYKGRKQTVKRAADNKTG